MILHIDFSNASELIAVLTFIASVFMTGFKIGEYKAKQEANKPKVNKLKLSSKSVLCKVCNQNVEAIYKNDILANISCKNNNRKTRLCDITAKPCYLYCDDSTKSPPKSFLDKIMLR